MENIFNRLKFVHHDEVFATREEACSYVINMQAINRPTVIAEPMVLLYESGSEEKGPNVILAIGSRGNGTSNITNRTFFIDTQKTEEEVIALDNKIEEAIKSLSVNAIDSNTIDFTVEKTENGTTLSGDVKIADYQIFDGRVRDNIIQETDKGIYAFVDMNYDENSAKLTFTVNGVSQEYQLPSDQHVTAGWYDPSKETIFIKLADGTKVPILVTKLIEEWTVDNNPQTPIVLKKDHFSAVSTDHEGIYEWQDVLSADVRIAKHIGDNILTTDGTGRFLYVKGTADNIIYDAETTVKQAIDARNVNISSNSGNIIYRRTDGFYAMADLVYKPAENKLIFKRSNLSGGTDVAEIELNSVQLLEDIVYDSTKEAIVIRYKNATGDYKKVEIPVSSIIEEWDVQSDAHTIQLQKFRSPGEGHDILTADAKLSTEPDNILTEKNHMLYVKGVSENIKYGEDSNVKNALDNLFEKSGEMSSLIENESNERKSSDAFLSGAIDTLSANTESRIKSVTNEDHSIGVDNSDPVNIVVKVNLSEEQEHGKSNILKLNADGIYAGVDMDYNPTSNTLTFVTTNETKTFQIEPSKVIDTIYYDKTKEALIVVYTVKGTTEPVTMEVSLKDIVEEWNVSNNTNGAVKLTKDRVISGPDVLSAEVLVSDTHDDNMLVNDNGALYVSSAKIDAEIERSTAKDEELSNKIDTEIQRATEKENEIASNLNSEISRSTAKDEELSAKIDEEKQRAITKENELSSLLNNEVVRSTTKDEELEGKVDTEKQRAVEKENEIISSLNSEISRSTAKDEELNNKINNEVLRATSTEADLRALVTSETSRAQVEEQRIESRLNDEISRSTAADELLQTAIDNEKSAREADVQSLEDAIETATITFNDTTSVKVNKGSDNVVTADLKVANADDNIIKVDTNREGVYASVKLSYDASANKIKLITSNGEQDYIQLNAGSVVDDITYDSNERSLVLTYTGADGISHTVKFPVNDLFNDWVVENPSSGSAIELTKNLHEVGTSAADKLSGRVLLTNLPDNMVNIVNNGLYVSGSGITKANEDIECIDKELSILENNVLGVNMPECGESATGEAYKYQPNQSASVISGATSFYNADELLDDAVSSMIDAWNDLMLGSDTPTLRIFARDIGRNRHLLGDVRLSHGKENTMTDDELTITAMTNEEFSETNMLRAVNIVDDGHGGTYTPDSPYNGLYVSNIIDGGDLDDEDGEVIDPFYGNTRELSSDSQG